MELWALGDYGRLDWDAIDYGAEGSDFDDATAVAAGWTLDERGDEREFAVKPEDADDYEEAGAQLRLLWGYPSETPAALRAAVDERNAAMANAWKRTAGVLNSSDGDRIWLRLVGGDAVFAQLDSRAGQGVTLKKAYRWRDSSRKRRKTDYVKYREIVAAIKPGDWSVPGPKFGAWMAETEEAAIEPQLWSALCPECINAVKPPWRSGPCCECRAGRWRDIPKFRLLPRPSRTRSGIRTSRPTRSARLSGTGPSMIPHATSGCVPW